MEANQHRLGGTINAETGSATRFRPQRIYDKIAGTTFFGHMTAVLLIHARQFSGLSNTDETA